MARLCPDQSFFSLSHRRNVAGYSKLVSRCRKYQFARCFLPTQVRMWNDLSYTVFDTETLDGFKGEVNRWLLPLVVFSSVFMAQVLVWLRKTIGIFPTCMGILLQVLIIIIIISPLLVQMV